MHELLFREFFFFMVNDKIFIRMAACYAIFSEAMIMAKAACEAMNWPNTLLRQLRGWQLGRAGHLCSV